jgi:hypothetical protein
MKVLGNTVTSHFEKAQSTAKQRILKEVAEEKYPKDKYEIEVSTEFVEIKDKNTNKPCISYSILDTGEYDKYCFINTNGLSRGIYHYDKNGTLKTYESLGGAERKSWDAISDLLNKDIAAKNALGLPTTGKDFEKHIKQVNSKNIVDILSNYEANYGESLFDAINGEWGLDSKVKDRIIKHLHKCLVEDDINTKIDKAFYQGGIGDCWVLAAIAAMQRTQKGQEILNNMITDNKDGSYTVNFKGVDKEITVSASDLVTHNRWSEGDMDVRILEIATEKFLKSSIKNAKSLDDGGSPLLAISLFSGNWKNLWNNKNVGVVKPSAIEKIKNLLQNKNMVITASTKAEDKNTIPEDIKSKYFISYNHAYAVHAIDDKNIYLKNPQNVAATIAIPLDVFDEYWCRVQYTEIT